MNAARQALYEKLRRSFDIASKEVRLLENSRSRLFENHLINADWIKRLENEPTLADMVESFAARYGRLQDNLGDKMLPRLFAWLGEKPAPFIDNLNRAERLGLIESSEAWMAARSLRNKLVHEYIDSPQEMADALNLANRMSGEMIGAYDSLKTYVAEHIAQERDK